MPQLDTKQITKFFEFSKLAAKQLFMNSFDEQSIQFNYQGIDSMDGDFGSAKNIDNDKLEQILLFVRKKLNLTEADLKIIVKNHSRYIDAKNIPALLDFIENHTKQSNSIQVYKNFDKTQFYTGDSADKSNLSHKGMAIVQDYFAKKDRQRNDTFILDTQNDLVVAFNLLKESKEGVSMELIYRAGEAHWVPIKCEKKNGKYYIMEMDSLGTPKDYTSNNVKDLMVVKAVSDTFKTEAVVIYRAKNARQFSANNCGIFSIKDARKMQNDPHLVEKLAAHEIDTPKMVGNNIRYIEYLTPVEYMKTVQSNKAIKNYVNEFNKRKIKVDGRHRPLEEKEITAISFDKVRSAKSKVVTGKGDKNQTVLYFKDKYMASVVDKKIKNSTLEELAGIVEQYDIKKANKQRINLSIEKPRDFSKITTDKEEIVVVPVKVSNEELKQLKQQVNQFQDELRQKREHNKQLDDQTMMPSAPSTQAALRTKAVTFQDKSNELKKKIEIARAAKSKPSVSRSSSSSPENPNDLPKKR